MLGSSLCSQSWEPETFPNLTLHQVAFGSVDYLYSCDKDDAVTCDFSSGSSDIEAFNFDEFERPSLFSDAFVSHILGDNFTDTDNASIDEFYSQTISCTDNKINTNATPTKWKSPLEYSSKSWSSMSIEEKEKALLSISEITCQLGLREQLEVIRIMDPHIEISAEMKEFTLDVSLLNDSKWKRIKDFLKKHKISLPLQNSSSETSVKSRKTSKASKTLSKKSNSVSRTSRKQQRQKKEIDEFSKFKRKQVRQGMKEEKSGLFVYEKVVKFTSLEEDEDVNILE